MGCCCCYHHQARVLSGRPAAGKELTKEFNVLEAGLYQAASLNKVNFNYVTMV
jgi:hypothetical protein